jgi:hypothetical protein
MDWLSRFSASLAAGIFLNYILVPLVMTTALGAILRAAFGKLKERREAIAFGIAAFVLFLSLIYAVGTRPQEPHLTGAVQQVITGNGPTERDTIVVVTMNVINTGTMQTIVKNWHVTAEVNGRKYEAVFVPMPETFTFSNIPTATPGQPDSLTFHNSDNLLETSLHPIQVGALLPGVLFVMFQNVDRSIFKSGVDYTITFEDVLSRSYFAQLKTTASVGNVGLVPGIKMDATCPVPAAGLPKLGNDLTGALKTPAAE